MKQKRQRSHSYESIRRCQLQEDIAKEDINIRRLAKRLKIKPRRRNGKLVNKYPTWMRNYGLDYILNFEEDIPSNMSQETHSSKMDFSKRQRKNMNIYGDPTVVVKSDTASSHTHSVDGNKMSVSAKPHNNLEASNSSNDIEIRLRRLCRSWLNRVSEEHMIRVITTLTEQYALHPRALIRSVLVDEFCNLLEATPVDSQPNFGWLQQDLAVCLTCIHVVLHSQFQHDNLLAHLFEALLAKIFHNEESICNEAPSFLIFTGCFFVYGVLSHALILDIIRDFISRQAIQHVKCARLLCEAFGIHLRKADLRASQELMNLATEQLARSSTELNVRVELESIICSLSKKHSKNEFIARIQRLKKLIRSWTKGIPVTKDMCLSFNLSDFRNRSASGGCWWLAQSFSSSIGVSDSSVLEHRSLSMETTSSGDVVLKPEVASAADTLGLRTSARRFLFNVLVTTAGGPDATASALLRACGSGSLGSSREREAIQIIMHCIMSEDPFNRFYPRILGALLNHHRRFLMMVKCAFWEVMKKSDLSIQAKSNAGKCLGLLVSVFDLPLTVIKNFDFSDSSEANISFLKHMFAELCTSDYKKVLEKILQLSSYPRVSRNCRIFIRKHFTAADTDENLGALVLRFADALRDVES